MKTTILHTINIPIRAKRLTPEALADLFAHLDYGEGIEYYKDYFTDDQGKSGHFTNMIGFDLQYMLSAVIIGKITDANYGYKNYQVSMTDIFWKQADDRYKQILQNYGEWPVIDPTRDLNKTQAEIDQLIADSKK